VAIGSITSSSISVLVANDSGGYDEPILFPYTGYLLDMTGGNMDGDDKDDIVVSGWPYHYLSIMISLPRIDISVQDTARFYGDANPAFNSTVSDWPGPGDLDITYETNATNLSSIGTYDIIPIVSDSIMQNFAVVKDPGVLTVLPAPLVITAQDTIRQVGKDNPQFRATIEGRRNNDSFRIFFSTPADIGSPPGQYPIVPIEAPEGYPNYVVTLVEGILTIIPESTTPPFPNPSTGDFIVFSLEAMTYTIINSSGLEIQAGSIIVGDNLLHLNVPPGNYVLIFGNGTSRKLIIE
jgi:MBG domain (YGX type)